MIRNMAKASVASRVEGAVPIAFGLFSQLFSMSRLSESYEIVDTGDISVRFLLYLIEQLGHLLYFLNQAVDIP